MYNKLFFIFLILSCITLTGCKQQHQLHQKLIIQGISVDNVDSEYLLTIQALDFKNPLNEDEPNIKTLEIKGRSLVGALEEIPTQTSLIPVYSQNMIIVLGEGVAESGVNHFMDFFVRHCESRPKVKICVVDGIASEILKVKSMNKSVKAKDIHDLIPNELNSDVLHFVSNLKSNISDPYCAWLKAENKGTEKNVCLKGVAYFCGDELEDFLNYVDALGFMTLKSVPGFESLCIEINGEKNVTCKIDKSICSIKANLNGDVPSFDISIDMSVLAFSVDEKWESYFDGNVTSDIKEIFEKKITTICTEVIHKTVSNKSDVFGFGKILKNSFPNYFKSKDSNWKEYLEKCNYNVLPNANVIITGKEPM